MGPWRYETPIVCLPVCLELRELVHTLALFGAWRGTYLHGILYFESFGFVAESEHLYLYASETHSDIYTSTYTYLFGLFLLQSFLYSHHRNMFTA